MRKIIINSCLAMATFISLQAFQIDPAIPEQPLNEKTELTVLNARMGSRFSFSPAFKDQGVHLGALGYDWDEINELFIGVETPQGTYCFRTCNAPQGTSYLLEQTVKVGMTSIQLKGKTPSGITVTVNIVSPFTPSEQLSDTANVKIQIVPAYYILTDLTTKSGKPIQGNVKVGLKKMMLQESNSDYAALSWTYNSKRSVVYYRDNSSSKSRLALAAVSIENARQFNMTGFNGLSQPFNISSKASFADTLIFATHFNQEVIMDNKYNQSQKFYYTKYWHDINSVLAYALENKNLLLEKSEKFENILTRSKTTPEEKWVISNTFRSDIANGYLLIDGRNKEKFVLAEGRFRHLSTIDVAHETELMAIFAPWRLKLQLDMWVDYMARRVVYRGLTKYGKPHYEGMSAAEYGPFLYHDVGDLPYISEASDYWYGPYMAVEENSNFALMLYWYWKLTGDNEYVQTQLGMVDILLYSVINRDTDGNGIADKGMGWSTYDNSDVIKRSSENVFLGVKQMMAYLTAAEMFKELPIQTDGEEMIEDVKGAVDGADVGFKMNQISNVELRKKQSEKYTAEGEKIAETLKKAFDKYGYIPCSLDETFPGWNQHSVVLPEGLFLPGLSGYKSTIVDNLIPMFKSSYQQAWDKSQLTYGVSLTSNEHNTWFSKIMVSDIVAAYWFDINNSNAKYTYAWNKNNYYAYNDGINDDGKAWVGFWYPRGISSLGYLFKEIKFVAPQRDAFLKDLK